MTEVDRRLDALREDLDRMIVTGEQITTGIEILTYKRKRDRIFYGLLLTILGAVVVTGFAVVLVMQSQRSHSTKQLIHQVLDCTQPSGKCWQDTVQAQLGNQGNALNILYWQSRCFDLHRADLDGFKACLTRNAH